MTNLFYIICFATLYYSTTNAQLFGGKTPFSGGGFNQQVGIKTGPAWGSLSQNFDKRGFSDPITIGTGAGFTSSKGHGLSGEIHHQPGIGGKGSIAGHVGLFNNDKNKVTAFGQHDRFLDRNFKPLGPETNSAGIRFENAGGANAFLSGFKTHGQRATGTVGGGIPITPNLNINGQTTFGHGMKPDHQIGLQYEKKF